MEHSNYFDVVRETIDQKIEEWSEKDIARGIPRTEARLYAYARITGYFQTTFASLLFNHTPEEARKEIDKLKKA